MKLSQARRAAAAALRAAGIEGGARDADRILAAILGFAPQRLRLVDDRDLNPVEIARLDRDIAARAARQPVAQIVGFRDFYAHRFRVTRDTLDPRPETETLVRAALDLAVNSKLDLLQQFVARRIAAGGGDYPREMDALLEVMLSGQKANHAATVLSWLTGLNDGLRGCRQRKMPPDWPMFARLVQQSSGNQAKQLVQQIGVVFGDVFVFRT